MLSPGVPSLINKMTSGMTIVELVLTASVIGILTGITSANFTNRYNDDRIRVGTKVLASWINDQRRKSIQSSSTCSLRFDEATSRIQFGDNLECLSAQDTFSFKNNIHDGGDLRIKLINSTKEVFVSPRGTINKPLEDDIFFTVGISGSNARPGCIKIIEPLGLVRIARQNSNSQCDFTSAY